MSAIGCDLSRYNIVFNPDIATGPIDFAIQKATQGYSYVDIEYENIWRGVSKISIRGAYHYQMSGLSWVAQADHFLETAARHDYHIYALDTEEIGNTYDNAFFSDTKRIIDYWRANSSKKVVLYTNGSTYNSLYYALIKVFGTSITEWLRDVPLWLASPATARYPIMPVTRQTWDIHQYSWSGIPARWGTGGTRVDENVFNGSVDAMAQWLRSEEVLPPSTGDTMALYEGIAKLTSTPNVRIRQPYPDGSLNETGTTIGGIQPGMSFKGDKTSPDSQGRGVWMHVTEYGGKPVNGWSGGWLLDYHEIVTPPPTSTEYILYVKDGVSRKFVPE